MNGRYYYAIHSLIKGLCMCGGGAVRVQGECSSVFLQRRRRRENIFSDYIFEILIAIQYSLSFLAARLDSVIEGRYLATEQDLTRTRLQGPLCLSGCRNNKICVGSAASWEVGTVREQHIAPPPWTESHLRLMNSPPQRPLSRPPFKKQPFQFGKFSFATNRKWPALMQASWAAL